VKLPPDVRVEKIAETLSLLGHGISVLAWNRGDKSPEREAKGFGEAL
jgi:hypothetical protein